MSAARLELPTAASMATLSTTAGLNNSSSGNSNGNGHGTSSDKAAPAPAATTTATATATATSTATAAAAALLPARRPRHQITRSITEFSPPLKMHRHCHSHHHHPTPQPHHHSSRRDNSSKFLFPDERSPGLSAADRSLLMGRSSLDMTRSEFATPSRSPDSSRRTSALVGPMLGGGENSLNVSPPRGKGKKANTPTSLVVEKERTANRVTGLKKSLVDLSSFSTTTTRRLDETYYSVLEKKSMLHNTISAIKELAMASRRLTGEFEREAEEMAQDVDGQLATFGQFNEQEQRIEALQTRIEKGRTRIQGLGERVDLVRRRIEGWERADREWQEKTRKRLRTVWIVMSVVFAILILLFIGAQYAQQVGGVDLEDVAAKIVEKGANHTPGLGVDGKGGDSQERHVPPLWGDRAGREEEDRLRVFDEL
ncbi:hypothetical protein GCG54_00004668 [Colletotrichum gloeosporioides]|uniref:Uncharacterized protein n=1 Tax=Colletotrichum gloeosporioides TaxID=474922 RepID=A0A8H4CGF3_COLGL|nr:uncharacterized protein GCG54_00004668 [Colletotrichum gloeosporioides]KAF3803498.1 hypothetical protein GCG54_00004668 [Colletotrichum gloeosporioides]